MNNHKAPVIIIAAARSGTKLLREILVNCPELSGFPYDANYIWKFGNYHIPHDELKVADLTPKISSFIKMQFQKAILKNHHSRLLEKTVSNSVRVAFVRAIFPNCKIIHLVRDGRDVAADARVCWQSSMMSARIQSKGNLIKKALSFPITAAWPYLLEYIHTNIGRMFSKEKQVKSWGPRFKGIDDAIQRFSLLEVCGMQWARSIELSLKDLKSLHNEFDYIDVRYENLVTNPENDINRIAEFLQLSSYHSALEYAKSNVTDKYIGFAKKVLSKDETDMLEAYTKPYLSKLSYN